MTEAPAGEIASIILEFLAEIGIPVELRPLGQDTFLPGIDIDAGGLVVDKAKLLYPGDLLHEAGHLAVTPADQRSSLHGTVEAADESPPLIESAAICWSYAACIHLGIDPAIVFHKEGYHGRSQFLLRSFKLGVFPGVSALEAAGMTFSTREADAQGQASFPVMQRWLRD